jgi:cell division protein FtsI (penicillin-binding protein 3)
MNQAPRQTLTAPIRRIRFAYVALIFCAWTGIIAVRLGWLQVVRHSDFVHRAALQQQRTFEVAPRRGVLYDRNLRELAVTVQVDSVYAVPSELGDNRASAAEILAEIVHSDPRDNFTSKQQMLARFNASHGFAWVARRVDAATADRVRELNLKGVYFQKEFNGSIRITISRRRCWGMWGPTILDWAGWSVSSMRTCMASRGIC